MTVTIRYEVCPKCGAGLDEDEQAGQFCDACGWDTYEAMPNPYRKQR